MASDLPDLDFTARPYPSPYAPTLDDAQSSFRTALRTNFSRSPWSALTDEDAGEQLSLLPLPFFDQGALSDDMDSLIYNEMHSPTDIVTTPPASANSQQAHFSPSPPSYATRGVEVYPEPADPFIDINFDDDYPPQSPRSNMTRGSSVVDLTTESPPHSKRKRDSALESSQSSIKRHKSGQSSRDKFSRHAVEEVDLLEIENDEEYAEFRTKQQAELIKQQQQDEADKPFKLAAYQCSICLDNPTDLVITNCGHMFCSFCLHEALNAATVKRACPICRATIGLPKKPGEKALGKVFFALEMKLMTKKRREKLPQRP